MPHSSEQWALFPHVRGGLFLHSSAAGSGRRRLPEEYIDHMTTIALTRPLPRNNGLLIGEPSTDFTQDLEKIVQRAGKKPSRDRRVNPSRCCPPAMRSSRYRDLATLVCFCIPKTPIFSLFKKFYVADGSGHNFDKFSLIWRGLAIFRGPCFQRNFIRDDSQIVKNNRPAEEYLDPMAALIALGSGLSTTSWSQTSQRDLRSLVPSALWISFHLFRERRLAKS